MNDEWIFLLNSFILADIIANIKENNEFGEICKFYSV